MSFPTCDRTMQNLGVHDQRIFWCPSCGTTKFEQGNDAALSVPAILRRIIDAANLDPPLPHRTQWRWVDVEIDILQAEMQQPRIAAIYQRSGKQLF